MIRSIRGTLSRGTLSRLLALALLLSASAAAWAGVVPSSAESVPGGVTRFWPQGADRTQFSFALKDGSVAGSAVTPSGAVQPVFSHGFWGGNRAQVALSPDWDLYGTGEVAGGLRRNGARTYTWNTDSYGYGPGAQQLYESHPWVLAVAKDGSSLGILADTTYKTEIDLRDGVRFASDGPPFPVYLLPGKSPQEVLGKLGALTGTMPMPPKWAIGYQQCRYSYYPEARVREIAKTFRDKAIPADVIWLDIHYMRDYRIFTFDPEKFPNPTQLNADLHAQGFHSIWMIDPGVKVDPDYFVYKTGSAIDAWVKDSSGKPFQGPVWPGPCVFPDFTKPEVQAWWVGLYQPFLAKGVDGVWNDMNEPSVFDDLHTMPNSNLFAGYGGGTHARFHNVYGMLMVKGTRAALEQAHPDRRPFVLSRASYIGGQRLAAAWTGDNTANWTHLGLSVPMALNMGLSGQPFAGPDIGGFIGDGDPKMFARWMGIGALLPFCRAHADRHDKDKEPWAFGQATEDTCRRAIERRYRLMPYLYSLFARASSDGQPVAQPVFFADPADPALRAEDSSFLLGPDLLVQTQPLADTVVAHAQPKGDWKAFSFETAVDPDLPVLKLRPGALLPTGPVIQNTGVPVTQLTLYANLDAQGHAEGWLYEDAGDGYGYQKGEYCWRKLVVNTVHGKPVLSVAETKGSFKGIKAMKLVLL